VPCDPGLRAEHALRWAMAGWGEGPMQGEDDEAVIAAAVGAHLHGTREREHTGRGRGTWIAAAGLAAAAAAVVLVVLARSGSMPEDEIARVEGGAASQAIGEARPSQGDDERAPAEADDEGEASQGAGLPGETEGTRPGSLRSLSGSWVDEGGVALTGTPAPGGVLTAASEACLEDDAGARLCVQPGAKVRAVAAEGSEGPAIEWLGGRGELTLPEGPAPDGPAPRATVFELRVAGTCVSGSGASVAVETTVDGRWTLTVREGEVSLQTPEGTRSLAAGDRWTIGEPLTEPKGPSRAATPDAATLLRQARAARASGEMADAAGLYRRLLKAHPRSPSAGPAWVALGQVELARSRASAALDAFDRYLERGGSLAEEAAYGRIEALRKLGRTREERAAVERFLTRYPGSSYAAKLRRRP
jgi:hypothetical protein